jgi:hypothetical protein
MNTWQSDVWLKVSNVSDNFTESILMVNDPANAVKESVCRAHLGQNLNHFFVFVYTTLMMTF